MKIVYSDYSCVMIGRLWVCFVLLGKIKVHLLPFIPFVPACVGGKMPEHAGAVVPRMVSRNQSYEVLKGSSHVLECRVENLGKFVVLWRKGDRILSAGKLLVRKDGKVTVTEKYELMLSDIEESDAGEYVCEVDVFGETKDVRHQLDVLGECTVCSVRGDKDQFKK